MKPKVRNTDLTGKAAVHFSKVGIRVNAIAPCFSACYGV